MWIISSDGDRKTLRIQRWVQAERDATGYLSSEVETYPRRFRSRQVALRVLAVLNSK